MDSANFWSFWIPGQPGVSALIWIIIFVVLMYIARTPAHQAILVVTQSIRNALRIMARSVHMAEGKLRQRNREVLLS